MASKIEEYGVSILLMLSCNSILLKQCSSSVAYKFPHYQGQYG